MAARERREILGYPVDDVTGAEALDLCTNWCVHHEVGHHVVTINALGIVLARENPTVAAALRDASLVVADGISIILAARILGVRIGGRVTGVELTRELLRTGEKKGFRFFFFGSKQEVLDALVKALPAQFGDVQIAGVQHGYVTSADESRIVEMIKRSEPDVVLVGLPNPLAEEWIYRNKRNLGASVVIGVGGTFDVLSGMLKRSPRIFQVLGIEWLWRLALEPRKRWRIIFIQLPKFLSLILRERVRSMF